MSNTKTIAKNTGWYGIETAISFVVTLVTSIAIARTLGPSKMGYIIYLSWVASVVSRLGGVGIPAMMRKYMAEFLGMGDRGTARFIYIRTLLLQAGLATFATAGILFWILRDAQADYRAASIFIALSIWFSMVNFMSAQANVAAEKLSANLPASLISTLIFFIGIATTVVLKWGVLGVGASMFITAAVDCLVRLFPTLRRILAWETAHVLPAGLTARMVTFAWQSVTSTVVALVVWERSEFILLKHLCSDIRQVAFYSVAFSMGDRLLISASIFGTAIGATIFAQYGRDKSRVPEITASAFRYLAISSIPLHIISAALAVPILLLLYGNQYRGAMMVVAIAPILCMPKAFLEPARNLLQSAERQSLVIFATAFAGIVDIGIAWYLIPAHGAVGACIGSGVAQTVAIALLWGAGIYLYRVKLPWVLLAKVMAISVLAALAAHYVGRRMPPFWALLWGGSAALAVLLGLFYLLRVLEPEDHARVSILTRSLPKSIGGPVEYVVSLLIRPRLAGLTATSV